MPKFTPGQVFVVRHIDKYAASCRHVYCGAWQGLTSPCVRWWKTRKAAEKFVKKISEFGDYPGGMKITTAVIELVDRRMIGKPIDGKTIKECE